MRDAAQRTLQYTKEWKRYCKTQGITPAVEPVLVVQVEDGSEATLTRTDLAKAVDVLEKVYGRFAEGELAHCFKRTLALDVELHVVAMDGFPPLGWPLGERVWVNPSPNAPTLAMARCYSGTVMLEGTTLSEGRGTTRPLELLGAPDIDATRLRREMERLAPQWLQGCRLRECWFEPTFHKHVGKLCAGLQIHAEEPLYRHDVFRPWRLMAAAFKALRSLRPDYPLWRDFAYEYERDRLAIDLINGGEALRRWVDDPAASATDLDALARVDEDAWRAEREALLLYPC